MASVTIDRYVHLIPAVKHSPKQYLWSSYDAEADVLLINSFFRHATKLTGNYVLIPTT